MQRQQAKYRESMVSRAMEYAGKGFHTFVGSDCRETRVLFRKLFVAAVRESPIQLIRCEMKMDEAALEDKVIGSTTRLVDAIGAELRDANLTISTSLNSGMLHFACSERQGYLIMEEIQTVFCDQRLITCERALRSPMQYHDDIAVILIGTNEVIDQMLGDPSRPFYKSFRAFRLGSIRGEQF